MITKNIFNNYLSSSIHQLSPIQTHKNYSIRQPNSQNKQLFRNYSHQKNIYSNLNSDIKSNQNNINMINRSPSKNYTDEKNSMLLRSYDKEVSKQRYEEKFNHIDSIKVRESQSKLNNSSDNSPVFQRSNQYHPYGDHKKSPNRNHMESSQRDHRKSPRRDRSQNNYRSDYQEIYSKPIPLPVASEYELLLQYQLKRQKQKNQILQKRLQSKQQFIKDMKSIQQELTVSFAACQQQLNRVNILIFQNQHKEKNQKRQQIQEISDLKHQIRILQQKLQQKEKDIPKRRTNGFIRDQIIEEVQVKTKKSKSPVDLIRNNSDKNVSIQNFPPNPKKIQIKQQLKQKNNQIQKNMMRSKTHSHLEFQRKNDLNLNKKNTTSLSKQNTPFNSQFSSINPSFPQRISNQSKQQVLHTLKQQVVLNAQKISVFIQFFINMCDKIKSVISQNQFQFYQISNQNDQKRNKLTNELNDNWRMLKNVCKQWINWKKQRLEQKQVNIRDDNYDTFVNKDYYQNNQVVQKNLSQNQNQNQNQKQSLKQSNKNDKINTPLGQLNEQSQEQRDQREYKMQTQNRQETSNKKRNSLSEVELSSIKQSKIYYQQKRY